MLREETKVNHDTAILDAHKRGRASIAREIPERRPLPIPHLKHLHLDANALAGYMSTIVWSFFFSHDQSTNKEKDGEQTSPRVRVFEKSRRIGRSVNTTEIRTS